jgi:hypothetical protein
MYAKGQWRVPAEPPYLFIDNTREYLRRYKNPNPPCLAGRESLLPCPPYFPKARGYQSSGGRHAKPAEQPRHIAADLLVTVQELSADRNSGLWWLICRSVRRQALRQP